MCGSVLHLPKPWEVRDALCSRWLCACEAMWVGDPNLPREGLQRMSW